MNRGNALRSLCASLILANLAGPAVADDLLPLWQLDGNSNRIYLLGSVHLLRESDLPLPDGILTAYDDAEAIIMELDTDDLDLGEAQAITVELGVLSQGGSLAALLGSEAFGRAQVLAERADVPLQLVGQTEPWLAAITVEQLLLTKLGFSSAFGLDQQITDRAIADGKAITGLETLRQQLELLDQLPANVQRNLLLQTLEDGAVIETTMDALVSAWRRGDTATLERTMLADMREQPVLHQRLVVDRNHDWVRQIVALLDDRDDYLVVVGALHLIGEEGVPALLARDGIEVRQLGAR